MWLALLLLLLPTALRLSLAGPLQESVLLFRLTQQGPWGSGTSNATGSPCEGLFLTGATTLTLENRNLKHLPGCLPRALRSLDGSHNLLSALGASELGHLPQLQELTLRHNRISALSWGPGWPPELHALDLSNNQLVALPPCARPALGSLRALELSGNPLQEVQPGAFDCFPALRLLNLSDTALGSGAQVGIADATFAPLATLEVLDLSGTLLKQVQSGWIRDLPKLTSLYLRKMPRLKSLEGDIFKMTPDLQQLDCQDSPALTSVQTHIFQDTPRLQLLLLQNCNLSSFPPWTLHSSQVLSINLFGNPLTCSCELSWLLMDTKRTVLRRAADTVCAPAAGSGGAFSASLLLSQLPSVCHWAQSTTLLDSNPPSSGCSTHTPPTQGPFTPQSTALSTQAVGGRQSVTEALSHPVGTLSQAVWLHSSVGAGATASTTIPTAGPRSSSGPPRSASTAETEHGEHAARLVPDPNISASSTPPASKQLGLFLASRNPLNTPQHNWTTQATPQAPHPSPSEGEIPILNLDDYSEEEEERKAEKVGAPPRDVACDYHPCKHLQTPCAELQRRQSCRCPGLSQEDTVPDPPKLQGVSETTDTSALVHWCAPNSVVRSYQISYSPEGWPGNQSVVGDIYATARQHPLYGLSPGTTYHVCVLASNRAGLSQPRASAARGPCATFTTKPSFVLIFAGLCAASGLLLLSTLLLSACLCWRRRRPHRQGDTHLVAYKNPAFDYPLKLQTFT
ncbi:leucine-rich repeat neuronal protein 4 [Molossus molossus]|uniref:Leucine rich repeat neuronal 4 n=1 Tax=Molossus molossus TaxID=27622 RepID=A0A7J8HHG1_MOLMO|nr:leucine-rich repeat neuronal protein 4 [Molossus molossus]KAF6471733.1 leucine rich repeat neuronal 4 [Molossus molossus]